LSDDDTSIVGEQGTWARESPEVERCTERRYQEAVRARNTHVGDLAAAVDGGVADQTVVPEEPPAAVNNKAIRPGADEITRRCARFPVSRDHLPCVVDLHGRIEDPIGGPSEAVVERAQLNLAVRAG